MVVSVATLGLVGCGKSTSGPSPSPSPTDNGVSALPAVEILAKATEAAESASSVHLATEQTSEGQTIKFDLSISKTAGASGSVTNGTETIQVFVTESNVWVKADRAYWVKVKGEAAAELIGGRWLKAPANNPEFAEFGSFANYTETIKSIMDPSGLVTKGELSSANGQAAIIVVSERGQMWVATTGQPWPIQIKGKAADSGTATFSQWGTAQVGSAPSVDDTIDIEKLTR